jgi:hypothetical protein
MSTSSKLIPCYSQSSMLCPARIPWIHAPLVFSMFAKSLSSYSPPLAQCRRSSAPKLPLTTCHARHFRHPIPSVHSFEWDQEHHSPPQPTTLLLNSACTRIGTPLHSGATATTFTGLKPSNRGPSVFVHWRFWILQSGSILQTSIHFRPFCKYLGIMTETKMIAMHTS